MNSILQVILIVASTLFFIFIFNMVRSRRMELKYALTWLLTSFSFIVLSVFPKLLSFISEILHIKEPVNTLYLSILFFLLVIVFTLSIALSRNANRVKILTEEIGILKMELEQMKKNQGKA